MTTPPRIAIIGTGGTISGVGRDRLDFYEYGTSGRFMHVEELIASVPELPQVADVLPIRYKNVGSGDIGPTDWLALLKIIHETAAADPTVAGFVVTHGTATLEETAYFLNLAVKPPPTRHRRRRHATILRPRHRQRRQLVERGTSRRIARRRGQGRAGGAER